MDFKINIFRRDKAEGLKKRQREEKKRMRKGQKCSDCWLAV